MDNNSSTPDFEEKFKTFNENLSQTWNSILKLWTEIGFSPEQIVNRATMVVSALTESVNDINEGEHKLRDEITKNLSEYKTKVEMLKFQLNVEAMCETAAETSQSLLDECRHYKNLYFKLLDIKKERKNKYDSLMSKQNELCELLGEAPYEFQSQKPEVDIDELESLEQHIHDLSMEKKERGCELRHICTEMMHLLRTYEISLTTGSSLGQFRQGLVDFNELSIATDNINRVRLSLEKLKSRTERLVEDIDLIREQIRMNWSKYDLRCDELAGLVERDDDVVYNQGTLDRLIEENKRCHSEKMNRIEALIGKLRGEITGMWDELGFIDEDKASFIDYLQDDKTLDEDLFMRHESYLHELSELYEKRIELTRKIKQWDQIWNDYTQFEIEYSDPNRFKQKRYSPLIENKLRTKFNSDLNKLEKEILHESDQFLKNEGKEFKVNGLKFSSHAAKKRSEFDQWRQECRLERQMKMESAKNKTVSGSTKSMKTPMKRAVMGAPLIAQSAQVVGVHSKPASLTSKKSLASPLRAAATNQAALSPTITRRTALGQLQPNLMIPPATISISQSSSSSTIVAKQLKRRSIKSMHSAIKHKNGRRSRGPSHPLSTDACGISPHTHTRPVKSAIMMPPGIHVHDPHGVLIESLSPPDMSTNGLFKRPRLDIGISNSPGCCDPFLTNLNQPYIPHSTPLK